MNTETEIWAVPKDRIDAFLLSSGSFCEGADYSFPNGIRVTVESLAEKKLGDIALPQTKVTFCGSGTEYNSIRRRFVLEFLSGGG